MSGKDLPRAEGIVRFDFDQYDHLQGQTVRRVTAKIDREDPHPCWREMVVMGDTLGLHMTVNRDTDELVVALTELAEPGRGDWVDVEGLADCVGCKVGWWWSAINSQGYWDLFALSFEGVVPNVAFFGIASEVQVMRLQVTRTERSESSPAKRTRL